MLALCSKFRRFIFLCNIFCLPLCGINIVSGTHVGLAYYILSISIYVIESDIGRSLCKYEYFEILYNLCTIFLKYSINKNLAPALALLGRYRSARAMHCSSARSGGRILRIFPQYLRIFPHGVTTIRCQLFGKKFPQQNACLTLKFIEETVIYTFLQGDKSF